MVSDILFLNNFLVPGTIIMIDGRGANADFKNNFTRKWIYKYFDIQINIYFNYNRQVWEKK